MATVFVNLYPPVNGDYSLPAQWFGANTKIECLKALAPDDGEALCPRGQYSIACPDEDWRAVVEALRLGGKGLVYSVVLVSASGETVIQEAGELNSKVGHYTTRTGDSRAVFAFWFEESLLAQRALLAA